MGFIESMKSGIDEIDERSKQMCDNIGEVCEKIGSEFMKHVGTIAKALVIMFPDSEILRTIARLIDLIAQATINKPEEESPEELGMKAEIAMEKENMSPDDFETSEAYIAYLRENIKVEKEEIEQLSEDDRREYATFGTAIYIRRMEENLGVEFKPGFWKDVQNVGMDGETAAEFVKNLSDYGIEQVDSFREVLPKGAVLSAQENNIRSALEDTLKQKEGIESNDAIKDRLNEMYLNLNGD